MKKKTKNLQINVTEEDYQQGLAQGISEEALLKPGRHIFKRGGFRERHPDFKPSMTELHNIKVCVTIRLDLDVLNYFKELAAQPNAVPYETQINKELRAFVEHGTKTARKAASDLLEPNVVIHNPKIAVGRKSKPLRFNLIRTVSPATKRKRSKNSRKPDRSSYLKQISNSLFASSSK